MTTAPSKPAQPPHAQPAPRAGAAATGAERLSKRVMHQLGCSRREAEQIIEGGWVQVDGQVVEEPMVRVAQQTITIDTDANPMALAPVTLLLHKPPGLDATATPPGTGGRPRSADALLMPANHASGDAPGTRVLKRHLVRLQPGFALEALASGLVVFSQDARVLRKLHEDAALIEQELLVEVQGTVTPDALHWLNAAHHDTPAVRVSVNSTTPQLTRLRFAFKGSHPGLVAWLCDQARLSIISMKRLRLGRVALGQLALGQWRYLSESERF